MPQQAVHHEDEERRNALGCCERVSAEELGPRQTEMYRMSCRFFGDPAPHADSQQQKGVFIGNFSKLLEVP